MLSPTLFNFYPSDLLKLLNSAAISANIFLGEIFINCLLNADDLVIFSRHEKKKKRPAKPFNLSVIMLI